MSYPRAEIDATITRYLDLRRRIDAGEEPGWTGIADFFTDTCVYIDPAWGRVEGIAALREFLDESMRGLEDWKFPVEYTAVDGNTVVARTSCHICSGARSSIFIPEVCWPFSSHADSGASK